MDSFELNKLIGAFLGAVFVVFSVSIASDAIFHTETPEKPGYAVAEAEPEAGAGGGEAAAGPEPITPLLAEADPAAGEAAFRRCAACHTVDNGGANKIGPNLWGIVDRPIASHEGFSYSGAMKEFAQGGSVVWDYEHLDHFLIAPKSLISGTAMNFPGIKDTKARAEMVAYLRSLSDSPAALPEATAEPAAEGGEAAPAEEGAAPAEGEQPAAGEAAPAQGEEGQAAPAEQGAPAEGAAPAEGEAQQPARGEQPDGQGGSAPAEQPAQGGEQPAEQPANGDAAPAQPQQQGEQPAPADSASPTAAPETPSAEEPATDAPQQDAPAQEEEQPQQQQ